MTKRTKRINDNDMKMTAVRIFLHLDDIIISSLTELQPKGLLHVVLSDSHFQILLCQGSREEMMIYCADSFRE